MTLAELNKQYQHRDRLVDAEIDKLRAAGVEENFEDHLQQRLSADIYPSDWVRQIVHPIAKQIEDAGGFARVKVLGPMGIGARVSLHCYQNDGDSIDDIRSITFEPNLDSDSESPLAMVDYSENSRRYEPGTMGEMNGLNFPAVPIGPETEGAAWLSLLS